MYFVFIIVFIIVLILFILILGVFGRLKHLLGVVFFLFVFFDSYKQIVDHGKHFWGLFLQSDLCSLWCVCVCLFFFFPLWGFGSLEISESFFTVL